MNKARSRFISLFAALLAAVPALCQERAVEDPGELVTDRPDATESSGVIAPGFVQIETGLNYGVENDESRILELPATLVRIGLIDRLELRLGLPAYAAEFEGNSTSGFTDSELGGKLYLLEERGWRPETALLAGISLPTGSAAFSSDAVDPAFRFAFSHTLTERIGLGYNLGIAWESGPTPSGRSTFADFQYTVAAGYALSPRWGAFIEVFGDIPISGPSGSAHSLDGGVTYLLRDNIQLDFALGVGLTDEAEDWFLTTGVSFRLPR